MYTVIRFISEAAEDQNLYSLGERLNRIKPGLFTKLGKTKTSFSCTVLMDDGWDAHSKAIIDMIQKCRPLLRRATRCGLRILFDTAVEPEDLRGVNLLSLFVEEPLIRALRQVGATLEFSCYLMDKRRTAPIKSPGGRASKKTRPARRAERS